MGWGTMRRAMRWSTVRWSMMGWSVMGWGISTNWQWPVWEVWFAPVWYAPVWFAPVWWMSVISFSVLWGAAGVITWLAMLSFTWPMFERVLWESINLLIVFFVMAMDFLIKRVGNIASLISNSADNTFQDVAILDVFIKVLRILLSDFSLFLGDQVLKLPKLGPHEIQLCDIVLNAILREVYVLVDWQQTLRIWVCDHVIRN